MISVGEFQEQFGRLKVAEEGKDQLIENLIVRVTELEAGLEEKRLHLDREQVTTKFYQSIFNDAKFELEKMKEDIDSNSFVSVLIDGDHMLFLDNFVASAEEGGKEAARHLRTEVREYVSKVLKLPSRTSIRVRIYMKKNGLASTYCHNKILNSANDLELFIRGFNMGHAMFDFVDAGDGKECADSKLKAWFDHDMADVQCQAVIFGGSADNGYARLLEPYVGDGQKSRPIVLIEGPSFAKELEVLKANFLVAHFPKVFRNTKLASRRVSYPTPPPSTPSPNAPSYATTAATPASSAVVRTGDSFRPSMTVPAGRSISVLLNSRGQRLDTILSARPNIIDFLRGKKQCNAYHILGECPYSSCTFLHGARLDGNGIEARRWIARQAPCLRGFQCRDEKCLLGHQCPERACAKIGTGCRFTREMHNVDRA